MHQRNLFKLRIWYEKTILYFFFSDAFFMLSPPDMWNPSSWNIFVFLSSNTKMLGTFGLHIVAIGSISWIWAMKLWKTLFHLTQVFGQYSLLWYPNGIDGWFTFIVGALSNHNEAVFFMHEVYFFYCDF